MRRRRRWELYVYARERLFTYGRQLTAPDRSVACAKVCPQWRQARAKPRLVRGGSFFLTTRCLTLHDDSNLVCRTSEGIASRRLQLRLPPPTSHVRRLHDQARACATREASLRGLVRERSLSNLERKRSRRWRDAQLKVDVGKRGICIHCVDILPIAPLKV